MKATSLTPDDIVATLQYLEFLKINNEGSYILEIDFDKIDEYFRKWDAKAFPSVDPSALRWKPDPLTRTFGQSTFSWYPL